MAVLSWVDVENGATLLKFREDHNVFNNSVVAQVNTNILDIAAVYGGFVASGGEIEQNTINIQNNSDDIDIAMEDIAINNNNISNLLDLSTYKFSKVSGVGTTEATYQPLNSLLIPSALPGIYEIKISSIYNYNSIVRSSFFRFSLNGGISWNELRNEATDETNTTILYYAFPYAHTGGDLELIMEYKCETAGDIFTVSFNDLIAERKV